MKKLLLLFFTFCFLVSIGQDQDPKAKLILDDLSKNTKTFKTILAEVAFTMYNKEKKPLRNLKFGKYKLKDQNFD